MFYVSEDDEQTRLDANIRSMRAVLRVCFACGLFVQTSSHFAER